MKQTNSFLGTAVRPSPSPFIPLFALVPIFSTISRGNTCSVGRLTKTSKTAETTTQNHQYKNRKRSKSQNIQIKLSFISSSSLGYFLNTADFTKTVQQKVRQYQYLVLAHRSVSDPIFKQSPMQLILYTFRTPAHTAKRSPCSQGTVEHSAITTYDWYSVQ